MATTIEELTSGPPPGSWVPVAQKPTAHEAFIETAQYELRRQLEAARYEERNARRLAIEAKAERDMAVRALGALKSMALNPDKVADELMARIERDGAIHRDSLIDVLNAFAAPR